MFFKVLILIQTTRVILHPDIIIPFSSESYKIKRNRVIMRRKQLLRGWTLSMSIKPTGKVGGWSNIFHATIGKNHGRYGDRVPGIWFLSNTTRLHICSAVSGKVNHCYDSRALPTNKFTQLMVRQIQKDNNKYYYQIFINNKIVHNVVNTKPQIFKNVKFYAADNWYKPAKARLRKVNFVMHKHHRKFWFILYYIYRWAYTVCYLNQSVPFLKALFQWCSVNFQLIQG